MFRHIAATALVLSLTPATVRAQETVFTVNTASASVYKSPSTGSPVIGHAARGAELPVTRELGSWVRVSWPDGPEGVGYLHVSSGRIAHGSSSATIHAAAGAAVSAGSGAAGSPAAANGAAVQTTPQRAVYVTPATHLVGVGGVVGSQPLGFGASARAWRRTRLGVQVDATRYTSTAYGSTARLSSFQIEPSVLWSLRDRVTDYLWLRPYVGSGASLHHQTVSSGIPGFADSVTDTGLGVQAFGGGELTFAAMPQFALSVDVGYRWSRTSFAGFDLGGTAFSLSGRWYVK
jgi:hypothetical protein